MVSMLPPCSRTIALGAMLAALSIAQAAEPSGTLTLACQGMMMTAKDPTGLLTLEPLSPLDKPQPVSLGLLVDFTNKTVKGFPFFAPELKITEVNELYIAFEASWKVVDNTYRIAGKINRVTGDVEAYSVVYEHYSLGPAGEVRYSLKCKPTQRIF
jgi:hypothetical protein